MLAITLQQPWASLVASGRKTIECRSWSTTHRGPLLICAAARDKNPDKNLPRGVALCVVELVECRPLLPSDSTAACFNVADDPKARFAWLLKHPRLIRPFHIRGRQRLFRVDDQLIQDVRSAADQLRYAANPHA